MSKKLKGNVIKKIANAASGSTKKKANVDGSGNLNSWLHPAKDIRDSHVTYNAKYLGSVEVVKAKGVDVVKDAIKKLKISYQLKKSEAGHKGSKLQKVEIQVSIDFVRIVDIKSKVMICSRPLHRVSYCADDHADKKLFAFIAKEQDSKKHQCYVLICEKEAADLTITLGQAFQMAYRRYVEKERDEIKKTKEELNIGKRLENELLSPRLKNNIGNSKEEKAFNFGLQANKKETVEKKNSDFNQGVGMFYQIDPPPKTLKNNANTTQTNGLHQTTDQSTTTSSTLLTLNDSFDERFSNNSWVSEQQEDVDIKFDLSNDTLNFKRVLSDDDFFGAFDSTEIVNTNANLTNNTEVPTEAPINIDTASEENVKKDLFTVETSNFDGFTSLGSSPGVDDFNTKYDPFADVPDWNSVASEEISNPSKPGSICLDSNDNQFSLNSLKDEGVISSNNGTTSNETDFFNIKQLNDDSQNISKIGDPFDSYLTNIVANRIDNNKLKSSNPFDVDNTFEELNNNENNNALSGIDRQINFDTDQQNSSVFQPQKSTFDVSFFDKKEERNSGLQQTNFEAVFPNSSFEDVSAKSGSLPHHNSVSKQTSRPRPSSLLLPSQILRAPPTKESIKAANSPIGPPANQKPKPHKFEKLKDPSTQAQKASILLKPRSASHILPNVSKVNEAELGLNKRSRVSGSFSVRPIKDSILMASKSLENLDDVGKKEDTESMNKNETLNRSFDIDQSADKRATFTRSKQFATFDQTF